MNLQIHSPDKITPITLLEREFFTIGGFVGFFPWSVYNNIPTNKSLDVIFERLIVIVFAFWQKKTFQ